MTEIEKTIGHYEALQKRYIKTHNGKMCEITAFALEALKEKAEREKGCWLCDEGNRAYHFAGNPPNFCPECGKQLKEVQP